MSFAERLARVVARGTNGIQGTNAAAIRSGAGATTNESGRTPAGSAGGPASQPSSFADRLQQLVNQPNANSSLNPTNRPRTLAYYAGPSAFLFTTGLAEHRAGRYTNAVAWMHRAKAHLQGLPPSLLEGQIHFVLAMALFHDRQVDPARAALAEGLEFVRTRLPEDDRDPGIHWDQVLMTRILMREARGMIEPAPSRGPGKPIETP